MEKKKCPNCGEEIMATAKKCRHCGEWLENNAVKGSKEQPLLTITKPSGKIVSRQFSKEKVLLAVLIAMGLLGIAAAFVIGFHLWWLMVVGYIMLCYGVSQFVVLTSKNPKEVKLSIISISAVLNVVCLFISAYGFSNDIEIYIFDISVLYCLVFPAAIGLGVITILYSFTSNFFEK